MSEYPPDEEPFSVSHLPPHDQLLVVLQMHRHLAEETQLMVIQTLAVTQALSAVVLEMAEKLGLQGSAARAAFDKEMDAAAEAAKLRASRNLGSRAAELFESWKEKHSSGGGA